MNFFLQISEETRTFYRVTNKQNGYDLRSFQGW